MKKLLILLLVLGFIACGTSSAMAVDVINGALNNGDLDDTVPTEINPPAPGFFLAKPAVWQNVGTRGANPWEDEMSSEGFAGQPGTPTPATNRGAPFPHPDGCDSAPDCGVFFKPFGGNSTDGAVTGHLFQDNPAAGTGTLYTLTGWAGAEANFLGRAEFAVEFLDGLGTVLAGSQVIDITAALFVPNGQPFNYKQFTVNAVQPLGAVSVRARALMLDAIGNPLGGGQAYVVDDFVLSNNVIPEPASILLVSLGLLGMFGLARRR